VGDSSTGRREGRGFTRAIRRMPRATTGRARRTARPRREPRPGRQVRLARGPHPRIAL